jgi:hypothetical protein
MKSDAHTANGAAMLIRAVGRRCAAADPESWKLLDRLEVELEKAKADAVGGWRNAGFTQRQIADALGVSQQAVSKRVRA